MSLADCVPFNLFLHIPIAPARMAERSEAYSCPLADDCSSLCPEKLGSNPAHGSKVINLSAGIVPICPLL